MKQLRNAGPSDDFVWPTPHVAWQDPPWLLSGRSVTAWFAVSSDVARRVVPSELLPEGAPTVQARLRFYELDFRAVSPSSPIAPTSGHFMEATIGFAAEAAGIRGDISQFMWTDSDAYMAWGREAFGWPLSRGTFELGGELWSGANPLGTSGSCRLLDRFGSSTLVVNRVRDRIAADLPEVKWFIARRTLHWTTRATSVPELLLVRPRFEEPPARYAADGRASIDFNPPHPLHGIEILEAEVEVLDRIRLLVGGDVVQVPMKS